MDNQPTAASEGLVNINTVGDTNFPHPPVRLLEAGSGVNTVIRREQKPLALNPKTARDLARFYSGVRYSGAASIAMTCSGADCPFAEVCPLQQNNQAPVGDPCPLEERITDETRQYWVESLGVNPENFLIATYLNELTQIAMLELRVSMALAARNNSNLLSMKVHESADGQPVAYEMVENPLIAIQDRLHIRRRMLLRDLLATPFERMRVQLAKKQRTEEDMSKKQSDVTDQIRAVKEGLRKRPPKVVENLGT